MKKESWVNFYNLYNVDLLFFIKQYTLLIFVCLLYLKNPRRNIKYIVNKKQLIVTKDLYIRYWKIRFYKILF